MSAIANVPTIVINRPFFTRISKGGVSFQYLRKVSKAGFFANRAKPIFSPNVFTGPKLSNLQVIYKE
jgi:hypothetical protein